MWYNLVDKKPVPCDVMEINRDNRRICRTQLPNGGNVSTVFLNIDHRNDDTQGEPLVFESMYFLGDNFCEGDMDRYCTYEDAVEGHRRMVEEYGGIVIPKDFFEDDLFKI